MKKKILAVTNTLNPNKSTGKFWNYLLKKFKQDELEIISIRDSNIKIPLIFKLLHLKDFYLSYKKLNKLNLDSYSLIFNDLGSADWLIIFRFKEIKKNNIKIINLVRNSAWNYFDGYSKNLSLKNFFKIIFVYLIYILFKERIVSRRADKIITVSEFSKKNLLKNRINKNKIRVIENAIETNLFKPMDKQLARKKLNLTNNKFYLIFVGRFTEDKGKKIILKIMFKLRQYKDIELLIIDDNKEKVNSNLNINYVGFQENKLLPLWLNSADIFLFPTLYEGDSLACLEAASCGKCLISSYTGGLFSLKKNKILSECIIPIENSNNLVKNYVKKILELYKDRNNLEKISCEWKKWGRKKDINENMNLYYNILKNEENIK